MSQYEHDRYREETAAEQGEDCPKELLELLISR
jgi:hypothetical protein